MSPSVEPFNEAKYKALMDGLECSEISIAHIKKSIYDFRIESEFYKKSDLSIQKALENLNSKMLCEFRPVLISDGTHFTPQYVENGEIFLSAINVKENHLDFNAGYKCISSEEHDQLCKRVKPRAGDVLLRKVGVGPRYACVIPENTVEFSIFVSVALIRSSLNPFYLSTFINSKFGQTQLIRLNKGISQPDLHLEDIKRMLIPELSIPFQNAIAGFVINANKQSADAVAVYNKAEDTLNCYLAYNKHKSNSTGIKYYSESVKKYNRLDAEYYQHKYDALFALLTNFKTKKLGGVDGIVNIMKSIEPGSDAYVDDGIPFIRVSDVNKFEITDPEIKLDSKTISAPEKLFPKKDTILFSKDGSIGIAYKVDEDLKVITSGALLHLTVRDSSEVLPDYLTLVLNSPIVQLQAERDSNGAIIQHWKPSEIENVIVPILDMTIQKEITTKVQESFALRKKSKQLLEYAKQAVEMAIEQGEDAALKWLKDKSNEDV